MNVTGFSDDNNDTFIDYQSDHQSNSTMSNETWLVWNTTLAVIRIIKYVAYPLGIPGNILSAIVWLRLYIASENPSAIYLAALAINDLVYLSFDCVIMYRRYILCSSRLCRRLFIYPMHSTNILASLLILTYSVVCLIAIRRPLQVCCMRFMLPLLPGNGYDRETARRSILCYKNKNWLQFLFIVKAAVLKQQISKFYPQI